MEWKNSSIKIMSSNKRKLKKSFQSEQIANNLFAEFFILDLSVNAFSETESITLHINLKWKHTKLFKKMILLKKMLQNIRSWFFSGNFTAKIAFISNYLEKVVKILYAGHNSLRFRQILLRNFYEELKFYWTWEPTAYNSSKIKQIW